MEPTGNGVSRKGAAALLLWGSWRGSVSLASFHHLLLTVPECWVGFLLFPSLEELTSAAEAGSLRNVCPDPFAAVGALHGQRREARGMGSLQSQSCLGFR